MKKILGIALVLMIVLAGCGGAKAPAPVSGSAGKAPAAAPTRLTVTFSNASDYVFNEIYISPTASNEWGDDLLGSTSVLKANGSIDVDVAAYDYDNYDVLVVDEDKDEYHFTRLPLENGGEISIYFGDSGLAADVYGGSGALAATVAGTLTGADTGAYTPADTAGNTGGNAAEVAAEDMPWIEFSFGNDTGHINFTEVYIMPEGATETQMGFNHLHAASALAPGDFITVGIDDYTHFDILLVADNGSNWYYQGVYLEGGCYAYPTNQNGPGLAVEYADGSVAEYLGEGY